jgi:hypothetical protein
MPANESQEAALQALTDAGEMTRARVAREEGWAWRPKGLGLPSGAAQALLDELRAAVSGV